ncbi:hypothetical protein [Mesorhizobium sp.]|uniref:hypothetical protein n=1 Tax=Mesorhizobium sp. TaxID=1871066 RepID=UPI001226E85F|nr:hypothetical protein [Mesorhizobium sp.]TIX28795.1 MAG: hypothetical protein E5V35_00090 [Mesorhizobium sp.]
MTSKQESKWTAFAAKVAAHIRDYVIPQYGDEGEEPAQEYDARDCVEQSKRYLARFGKSQRPGEEHRDLLKAAHWIQKAFDRLPEKRNG